MFKILAFDGGGVRGIFSTRIIERMPALFKNADLVVGTSSGAINATGLQYMSPSDLVNLLREESPYIFEDLGFADNVEDLWNLAGAKYYNDALIKTAKSVFGDARLSELKKKTIITSFDLNPSDGIWRPDVKGNLPGKYYQEDLKIADAVVRSCSAPTYFPIYQKHIDGGVWANNPSMVGISAALDPYVLKKELENIVVLSIGTGRTPEKYSRPKNDLGAFDWLKAGIIGILLDGSMESVNYYARSLLQERYFRVQIDLESPIKLDDAGACDELISLADQYDMKDLDSWAQGFWR
jgi:patatin-like phospholipase/acyl hydrolase